MSLFIRAPDLDFLKPLCSKARFFIFDPARKIRDTNRILIAIASSCPYEDILANAYSRIQAMPTPG